MPFKYDGTGVKVDAGIEAAPEGEYLLEIVEVSEDKDGEPRRTKLKEDGTGGYPYVMAVCEIANGEFMGKKVWHNVTFLPKEKKGAGMALQFLKTIGEPWEGQFEVKPINWVGKTFKAKLRVSQDNKGRPKNEIAWLIEEGTDEVPF